MATTTWIGGSGDWNTASNWTAGVPTAADAAVFADTAGAFAPFTVSGGGTAASITVTGDYSAADTLTLSGRYTATTFDAIRIGVHLAADASLAFRNGSLSGGTLGLDAGATLGTGTLALYQAALAGTLGTLSNPIDLLTTLRLPDAGLSGTFAGPLSGPGGLELGTVLNVGIALGSSGGSLALAGPADTFASDIYLAGGRLEIATPGPTGPGPLFMFGGTLVLDAGARVGPIVANLSRVAVVSCTISAADGDQTVFAGIAPTVFANGSGHSEVIGTTGLGRDPAGELSTVFARLSVTGGTGSVTVFGADSGGSIFGGTAGGNVIVAGAALPPGGLPSDTAPPAAQATNDAATIGGGGDGDLLVATGTTSNVLAAATGRETLTGAGATGNNTLFAGTGADLVVAGAGHDLVVGGSGAATLVGGTGGTAFFAGAGPDTIVGGAGADYVQAGSGNATLFAGSGPDLVALVAGHAGGSIVVSGFRPGTDYLAARGYAAPPTATVVAGSTVLTFSDGTRATLLGIAALPDAAFI